MDRIYHIFSFNELKPLIFTQLDFWLFFIFVMLVFSFLHKKLLTRSIFLSVVSIFFYYKTSGIYVTLLIVSLFANYFLGNGIANTKNSNSKKIQLTFAILFNILTLAYFKYAYFFTESFNNMFHTKFEVVNQLSVWANGFAGDGTFVEKIILPVGVSFFTFQSISYVVDIYRKEIEPVKNFFEYSFFVTFFPQLVAGPFVLKPGAVNNITVGVVYARSNGGNPFESVEVLRRADDKAQALFENCFRVLDAPHAPNLDFQELNNEIILFLSNSQNSNNYNEGYQEFDPFIVSADPNADKKYRFQGYQIFQLKNKSVSSSELTDPSKSRLVAQVDIKDNVSKIINFEFSDDLNASIPVLRVNGENKGIRKSFSVTKDLFSQGNSTLVNFKSYYFMAIAYAYNNYKTYSPT
ncbi:MAG: hypothetical protein EBU61_03180, partial [Crocinitomicaceae bacterium]|nr:hypothetical protein [Crocinitomicaceae bacterium]